MPLFGSESFFPHLAWLSRCLSRNRQTDQDSRTADQAIDWEAEVGDESCPRRYCNRSLIPVVRRLQQKMGIIDNLAIDRELADYTFPQRRSSISPLPENRGAEEGVRPFPNPRSMDDFRVTAVLGRGTNAVVFQADLLTNVDVIPDFPQCFAIKCVSVRARLPRATRECQNEIAVLKILQHSEQVVKLFWSFVERDRYFIVLEQIGGKPLSSATHYYREGFPVRLLLHFAFDLLSAVAYMHAKKITHGDLHSENVMFTGEDFNVNEAGTPIVKVIDFERAMLWREDNCGTFPICGHTRSVEPLIESWSDRSCFDRARSTDMMSVGLLLYIAAASQNLSGDHNRSILGARFTDSIDSMRNNLMETDMEFRRLVEQLSVPQRGVPPMYAHEALTIVSRIKEKYQI